MIMHNAPMKRPALLLLLLAPIALAGCQTIKDHNPFRHKEPPYKSAQQERPLEVPPGMTQPPTTETLAIPDAGTGATAAGGSNIAQTESAPAMMTAPASTGSDALNMADTPASVYRRVGLALARGGAGQVTAHDDNAMTYQVAVNRTVTTKPEGGFLKRLFHRSKTETVAGNVTVSVAPSGTGSVVQAAGDPSAAASVIAVLRQRLQ